MRSLIHSAFASLKISQKAVYLLCALFTIWLGIFLYFPSMFGPFLYDDIFVIQQTFSGNIDIPLMELMTGWGRRAVGMLSFWINVKLFGLENTVWFHLTNVIIHLINTFLVMRLSYVLLLHFNKTTRSKWILLSSFFAGLIFLSHPLQTQAVSYIVQRLASLAATWYLGALLAFLESRRAFFSGNKRLGMAFIFCLAVCSFLAWHTKENSYSLPLVLLLLELLLQKKVSFRLISKQSLAVFVATVLALLYLARGLFAEFLFATVATQTGMSVSWYQYFLTQASVVVKHMRLLFLPFNQTLEHVMPLSDSIFEPRTMVSFVVLAWLVLFTIVAAWRSRIVFFGCAFVWFTLAVESSIFPLPDLMYEHRMYLPMVGVAVLFSALVLRLLQSVGIQKTVIISSFLILILSALTYQRNHVWSDPIRLWQDVVRKNPFDPRGYYNLSTAYEIKGLYRLSIGATEKLVFATEGYPGTTGQFLSNLAVLYERVGDLEMSQQYRARAIKQLQKDAVQHEKMRYLESKMMAAGLGSACVPPTRIGDGPPVVR